MPFSEIRLTVPDPLKDAVSGELSELGAAGIWENETDDGQTHLVAYFQDPPSLERIRTALRTLFQRERLAPPTLESHPVDDRDWSEEWKKSWSSFPLGERFFVIPSWESAECPAERFPIHLDPGQAFGTGTHETTQLTLEAMECYMEPGQVLLDLGTGSGILAIAARLLGAGTVFACDVDPVAVEVARENFARNSAAEVGLLCGSADAFAGGSIEFLLCNLTADVILEIFPDIDRVMKSWAIAVFSGVLNSQRREVRERAERAGHSLIEETTRGEWCTLVTRKHGNEVRLSQ